MRVGLCATMLGLAVSAFAAEVSIDKDRMLIVNGQRTFVLGLYETPKDDAILKAASDAGFNLVHAGPSVEVLDKLQAHGLYGWINTGAAIDLSVDADARRGQLNDLVAQYAQHPALLVWEVPDEALWNCWYSAQTWRFFEEPHQLAERIDALPDAAQADKLRELLKQATAARFAGKYKVMEETADGIWRQLGSEPPHPELNLSNAAERAAKMAGGMKTGYGLLRAADPRHPIWMNHAPRNQIAQLAAFNQAADIVGCDIYPVTVYVTGHSDLMDKSLASVGAYTLRMQEAAPGKPVWMVLQGFSWNDIQDIKDPFEKERQKRPTFEQSRFMAYDSIVRGARGILYWGTAYVEKDSPFWADLLKLVAELKGIQHVLSAPDSGLKPEVSWAETWGSVDRGVEVLTKDVAGKTWLIVVNEWVDPLEYTLGGLNVPAGTVYRDAMNGTEAAVTDGRISLTIERNGVHVLAPQ